LHWQKGRVKGRKVIEKGYEKKARKTQEKNALPGCTFLPGRSITEEGDGRGRGKTAE